MHARVVTFRATPGKLDDFVRLFHSELLASIEQDPGFVNAFLFTDSSTNRGVGFVLYQREADVHAGEERFRERVAKAAAVLEERPVADIYELSVQA